MLYQVYIKLGKLLKRLEKRRYADYYSGAKKTITGHTLYHFQISPYSARARKAVFQNKLDIPFKDILEDEHAYLEMITGGKKDQVPCLKIEKNGKVEWMYESRAIAQYLSIQFKA
jgi:glutathione S-transferase